MLIMKTVISTLDRYIYIEEADFNKTASQNFKTHVAPAKLKIFSSTIIYKLTSNNKIRQ